MSDMIESTGKGKRSIGCFIIAVVFTFMLSGMSPVFCQDLKGVDRTGNIYTLSDLYRIGLKQSETVAISEQDLYISEKDKERALAVLIPGVSTGADYTRFDEEEETEGIISQPGWTSSWNIKARQSFTLNGKEFIALGMAEDQIQKSEYNLAATKEAYLFGIASAYYDVLKGISSVDIEKSNVKRLKTHYDAVVTRLELEDVPKTALYRAEAELSQARTGLIRAKNALRVNKIRLAQISGIERDFQIREPGKWDETFIEANVDGLKKTALENRAELDALKMEKRLAKDQVRITKGAFWPTVSTEIGYIRDSGPGDYYDQDTLYLALMLSVDLYDGGLRGAEVEQALARRRKSELSERNKTEEILVDVENVYLEIVTYQSVLESQKQQLEYARENFSAVTHQFRYGLANSVDVMDANNLLVTSQKELKESRYNFTLAKLKLQRVTGTFLETITRNHLRTSAYPE